MRAESILQGDAVPIPKGGEEQARAFYRLFALRETMKPAGERGVWLELGGRRLALRVTEPFAPVREGAAVVIQVDDAEAFRRQFNAKRARVLDAAVLPGWRRFVVLDPFQNRVEVRSKAREGLVTGDAGELEAGFAGSADRA